MRLAVKAISLVIVMTLSLGTMPASATDVGWLAGEVEWRLRNGQPIDGDMLNDAVDAGILVLYGSLSFDGGQAAAFTCGVVGFGPYFGTQPTTGTPDVYGFAYVGCPVQMLMLSVTAEILVNHPQTMLGQYAVAAEDSTPANRAYNVYNASAAPETPCPFAGQVSTRWKLQVTAVGFAPSGESSQTGGTGPVYAANC